MLPLRTGGAQTAITHLQYIKLISDGRAALFKRRGELQTQSLSNLVKGERDRGGGEEGREAVDESYLPVWLPTLLVQGPTGWGEQLFFSLSGGTE